MRRRICAAVIVAAAVGVAGAASGAGPWPGLTNSVKAPSGALRYTTSRTQGKTTVRKVRVASGKVVSSARFSGEWGIPAVTFAGLAGGLSPDGRLLVLAQPTDFQTLRAHSRFLLIGTQSLKLRATIVLDGEFGFDAISPDRQTLYVIQHAAPDDLVSYVVRAYDLSANRLLAEPVVDKREADEQMKGYPIARATTASGDWVYTLYHRGDGKPFVHALDTTKRAARCIDLPWQGSMEGVWEARLQLSADAGELRVRSKTGAVVATVDTKTFSVR